MSRIGKVPVNIPEKVKTTLEGSTVTIEGPKGKIKKTFARVRIKNEDNSIIIEPADNSRHAHEMHGTARSIIYSMVKGVLENYTKSLTINGVGFKAILNGKQLDLYLGYSHVIHYAIPEGVHITVTDGTKLKVEGVDKQSVGQVAADIRGCYPVEPYKAKGVTIDGQYVRRKEGKKTA